MVLVVYIIMNSLLAAFYENWKKNHETKLLHDRIRRYHALIFLYHVLVEDKEGAQTQNMLLEHWTRLLSLYRPTLTPRQHRQLFRFLDRDGSGVVELRLVGILVTVTPSLYHFLAASAR